MVRVAVFGVSGYSGQKLIEILLAHSGVKDILAFVSEDKPPESVASINPRVRKIANFICSNSRDWDEIAGSVDCAFFALPHIVTMKYVPELFHRGVKIIDLSADYRFSDSELYKKWYAPHRSPELLLEAVYGLPEFYREKIRSSRLIANPGCYPTSALLPLLPFAEKGLLCRETIVNSLSGFSGAGKKPDFAMMFAEGNESSRAYKIGEHRHQPEIEHILEKIGANVSVTFVPHLIPITSGMLTTLYFSLSSDISETEVQDLLAARYENEPFVRVLEYGTSPAVKNVTGTNFCDIGIKKVGSGKFVAVSALDNLYKGASGQAVQNMNIMYGLPESLPFYR